MLILFDYLPSQNAWKVRLLLNHLEQEYEQKIISIFEGEGRKPQYLCKNPTGAVPSIQLEDASTIADMSVFAYVHLSEDAGLSLSAYEHMRKWI